MVKLPIFTKTCTFRPDICCSGSGAAIAEFNRYKDDIEKATGAKVYMVKNTSFFGVERIKYIIEEKKND